MILDTKGQDFPPDLLIQGVKERESGSESSLRIQDKYFKNKNVFYDDVIS